MKKKHAHKWYETTLMEKKSDRKSFACKCGAWKVEEREPDYNKFQTVGLGNGTPPHELIK